MEDTVSVLTWECWLWEDTMDMTDCARLLLPGSSETGRGKGTEVSLGSCERKEEQSPLPGPRSQDRGGLAWPSPAWGSGARPSAVLLFCILGPGAQPRDQGGAFPGTTVVKGI